VLWPQLVKDFFNVPCRSALMGCLISSGSWLDLMARLQLRKAKKPVSLLQRETTRVMTIAMTTITTMRLYVTVGVPKIPTVAQYACTTNGPFTVTETSVAYEVTPPVQPEKRYVCPPDATSCGARSVACVPAAYQPPPSI